MTAKDDLDGLIERIKTYGIPNGANHEVCRRPLDRALWLLWASKEHGFSKLTAAEIARFAREVMEVSMTARSVANAINRAGTKVHPYKGETQAQYEIMAAGKEHIRRLGNGKLTVLYTAGGAPYSMKRQLADELIAQPYATLDILDPYCGPRTLDLIRKWPIAGRLRFITMVSKIGKQRLNSLRREIKDFCSEFKNSEFRAHSAGAIHDRYMITPDRLILLGHSIKDLGSKETFVIAIAASQLRDLMSVLRLAFEEKWKRSTPL